MKIVENLVEKIVNLKIFILNFKKYGKLETNCTSEAVAKWKNAAAITGLGFCFII